MTGLTPELASRFARLTLSHLEQQWPFKLDQVLTGPEDVRAPIEIHPIFHGSFDWHSCVHGWWQVMQLRRLFPDLPEAAEIEARANRMLTPEKVAGELAYFSRPSSAGASRPYGLAWLLALHGELAKQEGPWADALAPLANLLGERLAGYFTKLTYPLRVGTHFNSSFAMIHAREWGAVYNTDLVKLIDVRARNWFENDCDCQAWEPGGDEFLSSALTEALLMSKILAPADFQSWFAAFLPRIATGEPATLLEPAHVSDRSDGKIAHLDGLNLSRAWCWRSIAATLAPGDPVRAIARDAADRHLAASLPHLETDYMGSHWLASFALLAVTSPSPGNGS
jgi:hypothetical protein